MAMTREELKAKLVAESLTRFGGPEQAGAQRQAEANASDMLKYIKDSDLALLGESDIPKLFVGTAIPEYRVPGAIEQIRSEVGRQANAGDSVARAKATAANTSVDATVADAASAVIGGHATDTQRKTWADYKDAHKDADINEAAGGGVNNAAQKQATKTLESLLGDNPDTLNSIRKKYSNQAGVTLDDVGLLQVIQSSPDETKRAQAAAQALQGPISKGQFTQITDGRGKTFMMDSDIKATLDKNVSGFNTYTGLAAAGLADSSEKYPGFNGAGQNIYTLLQHSLGLFDPNFDPSSGLDQADAAWGAHPNGPNVDELKTQFMREQLIKEGKLEPPTLSDGTPNPKYVKGDQIPTPGDSMSLPGRSVATPMERAWQNPNLLIDNPSQWWTQQRNNDWAQFLQAGMAHNATNEDQRSDILRQRLYDAQKPQFDAYASKFGSGNELAAIVAMKNPDLGAKMASGAELTDQEFIQAESAFGGLNPATLGIISDSLAKYNPKAVKAAKGPSIQIVQPDRNKISEGFKELYRSMFHAEPTADELQQLVNKVAGQDVSAQYSHQQFDPASAMRTAAQGTDLYSQLYGNKPAGLNDADYVSQFERSGASLLGGQQASAAAVQAGMKSNNTNLTDQVVSGEKASWDNSGFLQKYYERMKLANQMV